MDAWSKSAFMLVAAGLLTIGIRNIFWSAYKEELRFRNLISHGLARTFYINGGMSLALGGLLVFAARNVPHSVSWQVLGVLIAVNGCIAIVVGKMDSAKTLTIEQMPDPSTTLKRVKYRRLSGVLFSIGGIVWILNAIPSAI